MNCVRNIPAYIDIAFCVVVLPLMAMLFPIERWIYNFPGFVVALVVWLYLVYFINRRMTVPLLFAGHVRAIIGLCIVAVSVTVTYALSQTYLYTPRPSVHDAGITRLLPVVQQYQSAVWALFVIVEAFSFAVGLLTQTNRQRQRRREVEAERDKAEIALYKAQIKPHFMFNTLNSLYGLFLTGNENAMPSLEKFISMMRYIHQTSHRDFIALSDEVDYIKEYVGLQELRLNDMTSVSLETDIRDYELAIPPMLLITFVENAFKHGVSPEERGDISIRISEKGGKLDFMTENCIFPASHTGEHTGIENCRRRLQLLYPSRHSLSITSDGTAFKVKLIIMLSDDKMRCHR